MDKIREELKNIGYDGTIGEGEVRNWTNGELRKYAFVSFLKKGNKNLIKQLLDLGWEKKWEYKTFGSEMYSGYSMTVEYMKFC